MDKPPPVKLRFEPRPVALLGVLMLASALTEGVGLVLLIPMLSVLGAGEGGTGAIGTILTAIGIPLALGPLLALFVALVLLRSAIRYAHAIAAQRFETSLVDGLRGRAWSALLHCDWRTLAGMRQSENAGLLITNIDRIGYGVNQLIAGLAAGITLGGVGLAALAISPRVSLAGLAGGVLILLAYSRTRRRALALGDALSAAYGSVFGRITEGLGALRVIKSFGREARAEQDVMVEFAGLRRAQLAYVRDTGLGQMALHGGGALLLAAVVWIGIERWHVGAVTILPLAALFARALPLLGALQESWQNWEHSRPAVTATFSLIAAAEAAREPDPDLATAPALTREIALADVAVRFPGRQQPALDGVSLTIPARRITALLGPSGAGKSTVADLLGGLIAPDQGEVAIDGVLLEAGKRRAWRSRVTYVQQEPVLFAGTIRENLAWAHPQASEAAMRAALADAAAGFVEALPLGLDTLVGEGGRLLSGGERQRIVLARALLGGPDLLILDEATSALDSASEAAIAAALSLLRERLTILVIGHRGALQGLADNTIWLESGRVVKREI